MAHGRGDAANAAGEHGQKEKHDEIEIDEIEIDEIQGEALTVFRRGAISHYSEKENNGFQ